MFLATGVVMIDTNQFILIFENLCILFFLWHMATSIVAQRNVLLTLLRLCMIFCVYAFAVHLLRYDQRLRPSVMGDTIAWIYAHPSNALVGGLALVLALAAANVLPLSCFGQR